MVNAAQSNLESVSFKLTKPKVSGVASVSACDGEPPSPSKASPLSESEESEFYGTSSVIAAPTIIWCVCGRT